VAVVGAGHLPGIQANWEAEFALAELENLNVNPIAARKAAEAMDPLAAARAKSARRFCLMSGVAVVCSVLMLLVAYFMSR